MSWTRRHTLIAGLGVIALTNTVALGGAAWNRSGEPEAQLRLSQRELRVPYTGSDNRENSGMSLELAWRTPAEPDSANAYAWRYGGSSGSPVWLNAAKMKELGFDAPGGVGDPDRNERRYAKQLEREVLLVLELNGPAYKRSLELAKQYAEGEGNIKNGREALEWEMSRNSRLFVIDAGLNADALRAKYPDRARYALVRGRVQPTIVNRKTGAAGIVEALSVDSINVPYALRGVFAKPGETYREDGSKIAFEATIAWGRRLEPWLVDAARK